MAHARGRGKTIDTVHWTGWFQKSTLALAAGGQVAVTVTTAQHLPETLLRLRGSLMAWIDGAPTDGDLAEVGVGLIMVAEGTGTSVVWSTLLDTDAPWIWYSSFFLGYNEFVTDVISAQCLACYREVIDSKSMRKFRNHELQFVTENITVGGATPINVIANGRGLWGS